MAAVTLQPAHELPFDRLVSAFNSGYAGYLVPVNISEDQLRHHIEHHDIDLGLSWIAVCENEIAGIVLLGIRQQNGWIGGLGVHPDYRRHGIGRQLMQATIDSAAANQVKRLSLEVISGNEAAHKLYLDLGFNELRRLLVLESEISLSSETQTTHEIPSATIHDALQYFNDFHHVPTPWQRSYETLIKLDESTTQSWLLAQDNQALAYVIGRASATNIQFFDMASSHEDDLHNLMSHIHQQYPGAKARFVNLGEDEAVWPVLETLGYQKILSQHEMMLII